jgi:hypothetical protein
MAAAQAHRGVDLLGAGQALLVRGDRAEQHRYEQAVHDEAGRVHDRHGGLAEGARRRPHTPRARRARWSARCAISTSAIAGTGEKKCRPTRAVAAAAAPTRSAILSVEVFEARTAVGATIASSRANSARLASEVLDDRLDHQIAAGQGREVGREGQPALRGGRSLGRQLALGDPARHRLDDAVAQAADVAAAGLHDDHREAGQGGHLRDAGAHQSTADDADRA